MVTPTDESARSSVAPLPTAVAVIATGVIGRSWLRVFSRAGIPVRAWDPDPARLAQAVAWHADAVAAEETEPGRIADAVARITAAPSLAAALADVDYVQESGPESLEAKRAIYVELARLAPRRAILASSTSALDMTAIAAGLESAERCIVAHPVNPPHVVPVVEVLGGAETSEAVVARTMAWLRAVGQVPVRLNHYVPGFLLNRMQAALVREAVDLVARGVASADDVDAVIRDGLGLRWAFLGPYGTADTNADAGARDYFARYGSSYQALWADLRTDVQFDQALLDRIEAETEPMTRGRTAAERRAWRDRAVTALRALKADLSRPPGAP
jgi:3-hydroxyacyl-CoA dehydrogenase